MAKFLSSAEASKKLTEFKETWYSIAQKCESLSEYQSGLEEPFHATLSEINYSIKKCSNHLQELEPSLKHLMPSKKDLIDDQTSGVIAALAEFESSIELQLGDLERFKSIISEIKALSEKLDSIEAEFREAEAKTSEVCTKYFERKRDYNRAREKITGTTQRELKGVKERFYQKLEPIIEGFEVHFKGKPVRLEELFMNLLENPNDVSMLELIQKDTTKGWMDVLTGKKKEADREAKSAVLKYISQEIIGDAKPIMDREVKEISRLDTQYADLRALEVECREAEKRMEDLSRPREKIKKEISELKKSEAFALSDYNTILELREKYLGIFNDINAMVKVLLEGAEELLEGYIEFEPDVEKRELKIRIKELGRRVEEIERERLRLEEHLRLEKDKNRRSEELIARYREKIKGMLSQIKNLEEEMDSLLK